MKRKLINYLTQKFSSFSYTFSNNNSTISQASFGKYSFLEWDPFSVVHLYYLNKYLKGIASNP